MDDEITFRHAQAEIHLSTGCLDASTLICTVSENAGALYTRYAEGEEKLANEGLQVAEECAIALMAQKQRVKEVEKPATVDKQSIRNYKVGDHVLVKLSGGRIVEIKAIVETTEGVRLQVSVGEETALIYPWQIVIEAR